MHVTVHCGQVSRTHIRSVLTSWPSFCFTRSMFSHCDFLFISVLNNSFYNIIVYVQVVGLRDLIELLRQDKNVSPSTKVMFGGGGGGGGVDTYLAPSLTVRVIASCDVISSKSSLSLSRGDSRPPSSPQLVFSVIVTRYQFSAPPPPPPPPLTTI